MAFCNNCGTEIEPGVKYCGVCGNKISIMQLKTSNQIDIDTQAKDNTQRRTVYDGEIHKCPNCGATLKAFEKKCPDCGYELRGTGAVESVSDFAVRYEFATTNEQKVSLIRTFVIPNTKEDILEFAILASSNIDTESYSSESGGVSKGMSQKDVTEAWMTKFEQAYQKAQILLQGSQELVNLEIKYKQKVDQLNSSKKMMSDKKKKKKTIGIILAVVGGLLIVAGTFSGGGEAAVAIGLGLIIASIILLRKKK